MKNKIKQLNEELLKLEEQLENLKAECKNIPETLTNEEGGADTNPAYQAAQKAMFEKRGEIDAKRVEITNIAKLLEEKKYFTVENKETPLGQVVAYLANNKIDAREFLHIPEARIIAITEDREKLSFMEKLLIKRRLGVNIDSVTEGVTFLSLKPHISKRIEKVRYLDEYLRVYHQGLTLARAVSMSDSKWRHLESGFSIPSDAMMRNIAIYFMLPSDMLLSDFEELPSYKDLRIDEDLAAIQRKDLSETQNRERNRGYIRRNYKVLDHKDRVRMISSLLLLLIPLGLYTGFCTTRVLSSRNDSYESMSKDGNDIVKDAIKNGDDVTKSVYNDYSPSVNKDNAAIVNVGANIKKIADIEPSNEYFTSNMSLWFDFDQVEFHEMYSRHKGKTSAWSTPMPIKFAASDPSIMMIDHDEKTLYTIANSVDLNYVRIVDSTYNKPDKYKIDWTTSDERVVTVTSASGTVGTMATEGDVFPLAAGQATVTASLVDIDTKAEIASVSCEYTVVSPIAFTTGMAVTSVDSGLTASVAIDPNFDFDKGYSINWKVDQQDEIVELLGNPNPRSKEVVIKALKEGKATLKAELNDGQGATLCTADLSITVLPYNPIKFPELTADVKLSKTAIVNLTIDPSFTQADFAVDWETSRPDIATINGMWNRATLTGMKLGETTITAKLIELSTGETVGRASIRCVVSPTNAPHPMEVYLDDFNRNYMDDFTVDPNTKEVAWGSDGNLDYIQLSFPRLLHNYVAEYVNNIGEGTDSSFATRNKAIRDAAIEELTIVNETWLDERLAYPGLYGSNVYSDYLRNFDIGKGIEYDSLSYLADPGIHYYLTTDPTDTDASKRTFRVFQHLTFRVKVFKAYDNPRYPLESAQFWMSVTPAEWMSVDKVIYNIKDTIDLSKNQLSGTGYQKCSADDGIFNNMSVVPEFTNGFRQLKSPYKSAVNLVEYNVNKEHANLSHSALTIVCRANRDAFTGTSFLPMTFSTSYINLFAVIVWITIAFYNQSHNSEDSLGMIGTGMFSAISATIVGLQMVSDASMFSLMTMINIFTLVVILIMTWQAVMAKRAAARKDKTLIAYNGVKLRVMFYALVIMTVVVFIGLPLMSYMFML